MFFSQFYCRIQVEFVYFFSSSRINHVSNVLYVLQSNIEYAQFCIIMCTHPIQIIMQIRAFSISTFQLISILILY